jgi:hypothetical protein
MALIEFKAAITISWCIGPKEVVDALKFFGIGICIEAEVG